MILYPTETLYALGVNALDEAENEKLERLKGRDAGKYSSWLVRNVADIAKYAELTPEAAKIAERFLPGSLTLILKAKDNVPDFRKGEDNEVSFRISPDPMAEKIIDAFMEEYDAPLTCTSANLSGALTFPTPGEILQQFGERANIIDQVHDDGPRKGLASTVVKVIGDDISIIREGEISEFDIKNVLRQK